MAVEVERLLRAANERLKRGHVGLTLERRGEKIWFRGTLPDKVTGLLKQQRFAAQVPANPVGIQHAERKAKLIGAKLNLGEFNWADWSAAPKVDADSCGAWVQRLEQNYWDSHRETTAALNSWQSRHSVLKKLPVDERLSLELLVQVVLSTPADSRSRQRTCMVLSDLAKQAQIDSRAIQALSGNYSPSSVEPRNLPSDAEIEQWSASIEHPGWQYIFRLQATYGLRNHECFHCDFDEFPTVWINSPTKTGKRFVYPLYPEWAERWALNQPILPELKELQKASPFEWNNSVLGSKVSKWFNKAKIPCDPYDLRHAYARRCFECGITPDVAAKLMGHSMAVHLKIYRAWIDEQTYRRAYEVAMSKRTTGNS